MSEDPFPETSFEYLYEREDQHWWFRARNDVILWAIKRFVGRFGVLLEAGCGNGYVLAAIKRVYPDATYYGNEYFEEALRFARMRLPDVTFTCEDVTKMDYSAQYDIIEMFDVLEHIDDDVAAVQKCHQALHPNGHLIISVPQHQWLWSPVDDYSKHKRRYSRNMLINLMKKEHFTVKYVTSFVSLLLPLMIISRAFNRSEQSIDNEWNISPMVNRILLSVMRFEFMLIKYGVTLPVGGSLLIVAQAIGTRSPDALTTA